jgi:ligand-binding sensor domain-containing protein
MRTQRGESAKASHEAVLPRLRNRRTDLYGSGQSPAAVHLGSAFGTVRLVPTCVPRMQGTSVFAVGILLASWRCAVALNVALDVNQYVHRAWRSSEGSVAGAVLSIGQTSDGYLWLGTEFGLLRFDGVRIVPWQPPRGSSLPDSHIRCLLGARDGTLWIGTWGGLTSWKGDRLIAYPQLAGHFINSLIEDHEGTIWAAASARNAPGKLCSIRKDEARCEGNGGRFGPYVLTVHEDARGRLWVWASTGLWRLRPGVPELHLELPLSNRTGCGLLMAADELTG